MQGYVILGATIYIWFPGQLCKAEVDLFHVLGQKDALLK